MVMTYNPKKPGASVVSIPPYDFQQAESVVGVRVQARINGRSHKSTIPLNRPMTRELILMLVLACRSSALKQQ